MQKLKFVLILLLVFTLKINASELDDAYTTIIKQEQIIQEQKIEIVEYKAEKKANRIIGIPFTDIAITKQHVQGSMVTLIIVAII